MVAKRRREEPAASEGLPAEWFAGSRRSEMACPKGRPALWVAGVVVVARVALAACTGDCNGNGLVSAGELTKIIALINMCGGHAGGCDLLPGGDKQCHNADRNGNGTISAGELTFVIAAIIAHPGGCPPPQASPTPTATPLGVRVFSIAPQQSGDTRTGFFTSGLAGAPLSANPWMPGPLRLVAGHTGPDGVAPLTLGEDVVFGARGLNGTAFCIKLFASGSGGMVDCDGGSAVDVIATTDSNGSGPGEPTVLLWGQGSDGGPGAAYLKVMSAGVNLLTCKETGTACKDGADCPSVTRCDNRAAPLCVSNANCPNGVDCVEKNLCGGPVSDPASVCLQYEDFGQAYPNVYTTGKVKVVVTEAKAGSAGRDPQGNLTIESAGENFSCASWVSENGEGMLANGFSGLDTALVGDSVNVVRLGDQ